jgi:hypothetical protein
MVRNTLRRTKGAGGRFSQGTATRIIAEGIYRIANKYR